MADTYPTTYVWDVTQLTCVPSINSYSNVVITAIWKCIGSRSVKTMYAEEADVFDPENIDPRKWTTYTDFVIATAQFSLPSGSFTPYNNLTEAQVLNWIWASGVDKAATENIVKLRIDAQITPPVTTPPLPWTT
jgi:hypothetical protein